MSDKNPRICCQFIPMPISLLASGSSAEPPMQVMTEKLI
jgi:hypothetical protein